MSILKKSISFCLSGVMAALLPITTSANCVSPQIPTDSGYTSILDNNKNHIVYGPAFYISENHEVSAQYNNRVVAYDIYAKIDTAEYEFGDENLESVETVLNARLESVSFKCKNPDGSVVNAIVLGFEQEQVDKFTVLFPKNGVYDCSVIVSGPAKNANFTLEIDGVNESPDESDTTPPEIKLTTISRTVYKPGDKVYIYVQTSEICTIQMGDKVFKDCNYAEFEIPCNGTYGITATDINGNSFTKYGKIDYMVDENATTTKPTTTTTKPTTTTTTTTTTQPTTTTTTTTKPTTTTTIPPTTGDMPIYICGDVNNDNKVTIADAAAILQYIGNPDKYGLSEKGMLAADVVGNGNGVTVDDAIAIQKLDAKIINDFSELK